MMTRLPPKGAIVPHTWRIKASTQSSRSARTMEISSITMASKFLYISGFLALAPLAQAFSSVTSGLNWKKLWMVSTANIDRATPVGARMTIFLRVFFEVLEQRRFACASPAGDEDTAIPVFHDIQCTHKLWIAILYKICLACSEDKFAICYIHLTAAKGNGIKPSAD